MAHLEDQSGHSRVGLKHCISHWAAVLVDLASDEAVTPYDTRIETATMKLFSSQDKMEQLSRCSKLLIEEMRGFGLCRLRDTILHYTSTRAARGSSSQPMTGIDNPTFYARPLAKNLMIIPPFSGGVRLTVR